MLTFLLLVLVPTTALGMVLGMARLEDGLLRRPAEPTAPAAVAPVETVAP